MPGTPFEAMNRRNGATTVIDLEGDVNRSAQAALDAVFEEAMTGASRLVLNFTAVDYINSTGIALIVGLLAKSKAAGVPLSAFGLSDHYREIFSITRLSDFLTVHRDEQEAMSAT
jgi:anti-anti-sigma factor